MLSLFIYTASSAALSACAETAYKAHVAVNRANDLDGAVLDGGQAMRFAKGFYITASRNRAEERRRKRMG